MNIDTTYVCGIEKTTPPLQGCSCSPTDSECQCERREGVGCLFVSIHKSKRGNVFPSFRGDSVLEKGYKKSSERIRKREK